MPADLPVQRPRALVPAPGAALAAKQVLHKKESKLTLIKPFALCGRRQAGRRTFLRRPTTCFRARKRAIAPKGKPWSFLHVSKAEIDLDPATDPYDRAVYAKSARISGA